MPRGGRVSDGRVRDASRAYPVTTPRSPQTNAPLVAQGRRGRSTVPPRGKVPHTLEEQVGQRVSASPAAILTHGNDADRLADDPLHKLLLGRDPVAVALCAAVRRPGNAQAPGGTIPVAVRTGELVASRNDCA